MGLHALLGQGGGTRYMGMVVGYGPRGTRLLSWVERGPLRGPLRGQLRGQAQGYGCALAGGGVHQHFAAKFVHQFAYSHEAESGALPFGGEPALPQLHSHIRPHAGAVVRDGVDQC